MLLVSRRTLQDAYARGVVYSMSRAVQHACAASIFHTSLASCDTCDFTNATLSLFESPCLGSLHCVLRYFDYT